MTAVARHAGALLDTVLAILLFGLMVVICVDVAGRYVFGRPLPGANELGQLLMALLVYFGLPGVTGRREHVAVGILEGRLPPGWAAWRDRVYGLLGAVVLAVLAWQLWRVGAQLAAYGDTTALLRWPVAPFAKVCAVLAALSVPVQLVVTLAPRRA